MIAAILSITGLLAGGDPVNGVGVPPAEITAPDWEERPTSDDLVRAFPAKALRKGISGHAVLKCMVQTDGRLEECVVVSETPEGHGFGKAALGLARKMRMRPQMRGEAPIGGASVTIPLSFGLR